MNPEPFSLALSNLLADGPKGLHEPFLGGNEKLYLEECVKSGFVSSVGTFVNRFEEALASYVGADRAIAVVNGTSALHLALIGLGVNPGDEVIVPALSFVATASSVVMAGAIPHFVDVSADTWGIDPDALRSRLRSSFRESDGRYVNVDTGRPVTAVIAMHTLGHPCDLNGIVRVAAEFGLLVIEDAAEAIGSLSQGVHVGTAGDAGVFSFNGNKTITTGGGGAVVTSNPELADRLKHLSTTAKLPHPFEFDHDQVGFNYRMPNINAALGLAQMEGLGDIIDLQRALYLRYEHELAGLELGEVKKEKCGDRSNFWLHAFLLNSESAGSRDKIITACLEAGVSVRPLWKPLNTLRPYAGFPSGPTPVSEDLYHRTICLPSSASLGLRNSGET